MSRAITACLLSLGLLVCPRLAGTAAAQSQPTPQPAPAQPSTAKPAPANPATAKPAPPAGTTRPAPAPTAAPVVTTKPVVAGPQAELSADYVIGPEDVIGVIFWREMEMTADVTVRPDGMITVPLIGDIKASGMRPEALATRLQEIAGKVLTDPNATVVVRQINSRKIFIAGEVRNPGAFPLSGPRTVLQAISLAGGLTEYAKSDEITIIRGSKVFKFNYKDVSKGKKMEQNIQLQPMDTISVP